MARAEAEWAAWRDSWGKAARLLSLPPDAPPELGNTALALWGTIDAANRIFAPTETELAWAGKIIDAFKEARAKGAGVVVVDGKLVEQLHVDMAERIIALAERIATLAKEAE